MRKIGVEAWRGARAIALVAAVLRLSLAPALAHADDREAAHELTLANALAPNPVALESEVGADPPDLEREEE
jgi:hypothetical protein